MADSAARELAESAARELAESAARELAESAARELAGSAARELTRASVVAVAGAVGAEGEALAAFFHEVVEAAALLVVEHGADFGVDARAQALQVVAAFFDHGLRQLAIFVAVTLQDFAHLFALLATQIELVG